MPFYALDPNTESFRYYPDPEDSTAWLAYRRLSIQVEEELEARCTTNGRLNRLAKLNLCMAWGLVGWAGYGEPDGQTAIPYDFQYDYMRESEEDQRRKLTVVSRLPDFLKAAVLDKMREAISKREGDLKNSENGWRAVRASAIGSERTEGTAGSRSPV